MVFILSQLFLKNKELNAYNQKRYREAVCDKFESLKGLKDFQKIQQLTTEIEEDDSKVI